eukprot:CAMPEP_0197928430 /NCGR_PEP_ID=MMETSP1439-20131203/102328_1 /TAXON_ID=66791 /ORGANISM="Gonyaulax spinifera, Strain CCMP409" /LENGTH=76 /DNA_ID=CAMNT_0043551037 /DNA_START=6 /DNA_END=233 /DNA_ORIENTATION=-
MKLEGRASRQINYGQRCKGGFAPQRSSARAGSAQGAGQRAADRLAPRGGGRRRAAPRQPHAKGPRPQTLAPPARFQ